MNANKMTSHNARLKVRTGVRAGGQQLQHNHTLVRAAGLKIKTRVRAGGQQLQHNVTLLRAA